MNKGHMLAPLEMVQDLKDKINEVETSFTNVVIKE